MKSKLHRIRYTIRRLWHKLTRKPYATGPKFFELTDYPGGIALDEEDETV